MHRLPAVLLLLLLFPLTAPRAEGSEKSSVRLVISAPDTVLAGVPFHLSVEAVDSDGNRVRDYERRPSFSGIQPWDAPPVTVSEVRFEAGSLTLERAVVPQTGHLLIEVRDGETVGQHRLRAIPAILSLLPPLFAILLALTLRQVVLSLVAGIWLGAVFLFDYSLLAAVFRVLDHFILNALQSRSHLQIIVFSMLFGGMVGVISRNGGTRGIAALITRYARTSRGGQLSTWATSLVLFFDDYANVLVRGNLMRPITDSLRISREKLAFLVDTGAATVASVFLISTWIGYEVGLIEQGLRAIGSDRNAYALFIETIPYRFYPLLALILAFLVAASGRDFGPMLQAERRARNTGEVLRKGSRPATDLTESAALQKGEGSVPARWINGLLPILAVLGVGIFGLYHTGVKALQAEGAIVFNVGEIVSRADSYAALLWASLSGCLTAILLSIGQRILTLAQAIDAWFAGLKSMLLAMVILVLAWSIGAVTEELHTASFLVAMLKGVLSPFWLPVLTFLVAALMSFATGTSWGTMAIMMPLVIPLAHSLGLQAQLDPVQAHTILTGVVSSVLAGAVFGDHCSPISDTTVLSSMASACDHIDHVRTQLPYALLAAVTGMLVGDIPTAYGFSPWLSLTLGTLVMIGVLLLIGRRAERPASG